MINPHTHDYVKWHQDELRRDAVTHRPRRSTSLGDERRRGSPATGAPRLALARLLMMLGAKLTPTDAGFRAGSRVIVLPERDCGERPMVTAA